MCYREEAIDCVKDHVLQIHKQIYAKYNGDFDRIYTEGYNSKSYMGRVIEPGKIYELSYLECTCPKVKCGLRNHPQQCECSRQSILYILSQLEPDSHFEVRIENTILRGSDRCTFRITKHKGIYLRSDFMTLRPFSINDAETILSWCKDKHAFRLWSADRYKDFPAQPEEMQKQYDGDNMFPLTAVANDEIVGHILLRFPSEDKSVIRFGFVIVDDSKRGKGYGKQLLHLAIDYAQQELGAQKITLGVFCDNHSAVECYKSVGFRITGSDAYTIGGEEWKGFEMEMELEKI